MSVLRHRHEWAGGRLSCSALGCSLSRVSTVFWGLGGSSLSIVLWDLGGSSVLSHTETIGLLLSIPVPVYFWSLAAPGKSCNLGWGSLSRSRIFPNRAGSCSFWQSLFPCTMECSHGIWGGNFRISTKTHTMAFAFSNCVGWRKRKLPEHLVLKTGCNL